MASDLVEFSKTSSRPFSGTGEAINAIIAYLEKFDISCLRAYLRGTAIASAESDKSTIVLVSKYIIHLQNNHLERFESFLVIVTGHMLANALLCPDLQSAPQTYKHVTFYLDTPLLVQRLGLEGESKKDAAEQLLSLLDSLGGKAATFAHSRDELHRVIRGAAENLESPSGRGQVVLEARRRGFTRSDLILLDEKIEEELDKTRIAAVPTPRYIPKFQIGEEEFEQALEDEIYYFNPRAKEYDINSVRSIYVLREGTSPYYLEKAIAVLVTSNSAFARAAWNYGQKYDESKEVSSVITDFSLANMAWLKAPIGAPSIPTTEVLAFSYAALQPTTTLLNRYLEEIDKLEQQGSISVRDHQLLRSSVRVYDELVNLTLGDEDSLTTETITETLRRVKGEIRKEEADRLAAEAGKLASDKEDEVRREEEAHRKTQEELKAFREHNLKIRQSIYWRCHRQARTYAIILAVVAGIIPLVCSTIDILLPITGGVVASIAIVAEIAMLVNFWFGITVKSIQTRVQHWLLARLLKRQAVSVGIDFSEFS